MSSGSLPPPPSSPVSTSSLISWKGLYNVEVTFSSELVDMPSVSGGEGIGGPNLLVEAAADTDELLLAEEVCGDRDEVGGVVEVGCGDTSWTGMLALLV